MLNTAKLNTAVSKVALLLSSLRAQRTTSREYALVEAMMEHGDQLVLAGSLALEGPKMTSGMDLGADGGDTTAAVVWALGKTVPLVMDIETVDADVFNRTTAAMNRRVSGMLADNKTVEAPPETRVGKLLDQERVMHKATQESFNHFKSQAQAEFDRLANIIRIRDHQLEDREKRLKDECERHDATMKEYNSFCTSAAGDFARLERALKEEKTAHAVTTGSLAEATAKVTNLTTQVNNLGPEVSKLRIRLNNLIKTMRRAADSDVPTESAPVSEESPFKVVARF